jgi:cell fate regulator YaaT (PSP1 superfamily)
MNYATIRYGKTFAVAKFKTESSDYQAHDRCIVRSDRGKELGEILTPLQPLPPTVPPVSLGDLLRRASAEDLDRHRRLEEERLKSMAFCREQVAKLNLPMKVIEVEHLFGGEKIIFYFVSETRVDFRELVKILAQQFRTRIELKQVGARDRSRLCGECGHCGMLLCCRGHKKELGGIQMEMAKLQKQTVDPSKVCGRCGKLLCCLSYEFKTYLDARREFPPRGQEVETKAGMGVVLAHQLMQRKVFVQSKNGERFLVGLDDVLRVVPQAPPAAAAPAAVSGSPPPSPAPAPAPTPTVEPTSVPDIPEGPIHDDPETPKNVED